MPVRPLFVGGVVQGLVVVGENPGHIHKADAVQILIPARVFTTVDQGGGVDGQIFRVVEIQGRFHLAPLIGVGEQEQEIHVLATARLVIHLQAGETADRITALLALCHQQHFLDSFSDAGPFLVGAGDGD